jgi:hypothetical protein
LIFIGDRKGQGRQKGFCEAKLDAEETGFRLGQSKHPTWTAHSGAFVSRSIMSPLFSFFDNPEFEQFVGNFSGCRLTETQRLGEVGARSGSESKQPIQQSTLVVPAHFGRDDYHTELLN